MAQRGGRHISTSSLATGGSSSKATTDEQSADGARARRLRAMPDQSNDYRVVLFGAGGVGKSSLVLRFIKGTFKETYVPTIEDTYRQIVNCDKNVCTLQITDTTGSHQFPAMQRLSITRGDAFILVYSVTTRQSIEELKPIYEQIREIKGNLQFVPIYLVGNKCDEEDKKVSSREGADLSSTWGCGFIETSAKTSHNVHELFQKLLDSEKRRNLSLTVDVCPKKTTDKRKDNLKSKCVIT
ncbi:GTP-binding protein Di-Ras2-like isoform X1 [Ciona intestinalis]